MLANGTNERAHRPINRSGDFKKGGGMDILLAVVVMSPCFGLMLLVLFLKFSS